MIHLQAVARAPACERASSFHDADVPAILRESGCRFYFHMADRLEPPHVHVARDDYAARLWLDPLEFAFVEGFRATSATTFSASPKLTSTNSFERGIRHLEACNRE